MRSFIQITDTDNDILNSLPLGDLSSTITYSFRVWNNLPQAVGIASLNGLKLDLMFPPKQGIKTLVNNEIIKIRCTFSGELSESISTNFQSFPISGETFDRLELNCFNEYEVEIDFSNLSFDQKATVDLVNMEFNITASFDNVFVPFSLPQLRNITTSTFVVRFPFILLLSDTLIENLIELTLISDSRVKRLGLNTTDIISHSKIRTQFIKEPVSDSRMLIIIQNDTSSDIRIVSVLGSDKSISSDGRIKIIDNEFTTIALSRIKNVDQTDSISDSRIKVLGVIPDRLDIESNTFIIIVDKLDIVSDTLIV